jgi:hypothetical protein
MMDEIKSNSKVWLNDCLLRTKTEDDLLATLFFLQEMSGAWIEAARQQVSAVCIYGEILGKVYH